MRVVRTSPPMDRVLTGGDQYVSEVLNYLDRANVPFVFLEGTDSPSGLIKKNPLLHNLWYMCQLGRVPKGRDVVVLEDYSERLNLFLFNLLIHVTRRAKLACTTQAFYFSYRKSRLKNFLDWIISRLFYLPMDMVISSSSTMALDTTAIMKVPKRKLRVVYPPIRPAFADLLGPPSSSSTRDYVSLLFVGYLVPRKGIEYLVRAVKILERPDLKLTVVGDSTVYPPYADRLFTMVQELGIRDQVDFVGRVDSVESLIQVYQNADIFVLPSTYESFGIVLVEAMCLGLPIVASRVGGIPELVEDGVNGILVPPKDPEALAKAISTLMDSPGLRREMGRRSYQKSANWRGRNGECVGKECYQALAELTSEA